MNLNGTFECHVFTIDTCDSRVGMREIRAQETCWITPMLPLSVFFCVNSTLGLSLPWLDRSFSTCDWIWLLCFWLWLQSSARQPATVKTRWKQPPVWWHSYDIFCNHLRGTGFISSFRFTVSCEAGTFWCFIFFCNVGFWKSVNIFLVTV